MCLVLIGIIAGFASTPEDGPYEPYFDGSAERFNDGEIIVLLLVSTLGAVGTWSFDQMRTYVWWSSQEASFCILPPGTLRLFASPAGWAYVTARFVDVISNADPDSTAFR